MTAGGRLDRDKQRRSSAVVAVDGRLPVGRSIIFLENEVPADGRRDFLVVLVLLFLVAKCSAIVVMLCSIFLSDLLQYFIEKASKFEGGICPKEQKERLKNGEKRSTGI